MSPTNSTSTNSLQLSTIGHAPKAAARSVAYAQGSSDHETPRVKRDPPLDLLPLIVLAVFAGSGCYSTDTSLCENGVRCPADHICIIEQDRCVEAVDVEPVLACIGKPEMGRCSYGDVNDGVCRNRSCAAVLCGNGLVDPDEVCDDGNTIPGDGCSSDCQIRCGDGIVDDTRELCDSGAPPGQDCVDYNYDLGTLGCSSDCQRATFGKCQSFSWTPMPTPRNWQIADIWAFKPNDVYAVGFFSDNILDAVSSDVYSSHGLIAHYDGSEWTKVELSSEIPVLVGIWGTEDEEIFSVGAMGTIIHYDGITWKEVDSGVDLDTHLARIWGTGKDNIFAVGAGLDPVDDIFLPKILQFDGASWRQMRIENFDDFTDNTYLPGIGGTSPNNIYAAGVNGLVLHYDGNRDRLWRRVPYHGSRATDFLAVAGSPLGDVVIAGSDGPAQLYHQKSQTELNTGVQSAITDIVYTGNGNWHASSQHGHLLRFNGQTESPWIIENSSQKDQLTSISSINDKIVFSAGVNGAILLRNGTDWRKASLPTNPSEIRDRYADNEGCIYYSTKKDAIYMYDNHRKQWRSIPGSIGRSIWGTDCGNTIYLATRDELARFDGTSWTSYPTPENKLIYDIEQIDANTLLVVGDYDLIATVDIDGPAPKFTPIAFPYADGYRFRTVWSSPSGKIFVGGRNGAFFSFDGRGWKPETLENNDAIIHRIWGTSDTQVFAAGAGGVFEFDGDTWRRMETPSTIGEVHDIWGVAPDKIFIGGSSGLLGFYDGKNWSRVRSPTTAKITAVWASGWPGELFIGTDLGEIHSTTQFAYEEKTDDE